MTTLTLIHARPQRARATSGRSLWWGRALTSPKALLLLKVAAARRAQTRRRTQPRQDPRSATRRSPPAPCPAAPPGWSSRASPAARGSEPARLSEPSAPGRGVPSVTLRSHAILQTDIQVLRGLFLRPPPPPSFSFPASFDLFSDSGLNPILDICFELAVTEPNPDPTAGHAGSAGL